MSLWKTRHESCPDLYCACGYRVTQLWIPGQRNAHSARHRSYVYGKKLTKAFPYDRIGEDDIVCVPGEETGIVSRAVYYLARDFNRECGFDFLLWPYKGHRPMEDPGYRAYLYVQDNYAVGMLLGQTGGIRFADVDEPMPALVRAVYTAANYRRRCIARSLAERFADDVGVEPMSLFWDAPFTRGGAALVRSFREEAA